MYIDAENLVLGRLASVIAKRLLEGEDIIVVNAEKALILGSRRNILEEHHEIRTMGSQRKGPFYPRRADRIFKRTVRGMLPVKKPRGREALKKLKVYVGIPKEFKNKEFVTVPKASKTRKMFIQLGDVSKRYETSRGISK